jgi:hypothetical protein
MSINRLANLAAYSRPRWLGFLVSIRPKSEKILSIFGIYMPLLAVLVVL